jgi:hypothetical protein
MNEKCTLLSTCLQSTNQSVQTNEVALEEEELHHFLQISKWKILIQLWLAKQWCLVLGTHRQISWFTYHFQIASHKSAFLSEWRHFWGMVANAYCPHKFEIQQTQTIAYVCWVQEKRLCEGGTPVPQNVFLKRHRTSTGKECHLLGCDLMDSCKNRCFKGMYCIVLYCIVLYLFSLRNIHKKDTEHCQHSEHTDNKVIYIKFKVPNIIIKTARLHNSGLKYVATDKVYKLNPP